jgi:hypothetical protein
MATREGCRILRVPPVELGRDQINLISVGGERLRGETDPEDLGEEPHLAATSDERLHSVEFSIASSDPANDVRESSPTEASGVHAPLFQVELAFEIPEHLVADLALGAKAQEGLALGVDDGPLDLAVLDELSVFAAG